MNYFKKKEMLGVVLFALNCILMLPLFSCSASKKETVNDTIKVKVNINYSLVGELDSTENVIVKLLESYLDSRDTVLYYDSPLWSSQDKANHLYPDVEMHYICYKTKEFTEYKPTVLSIQRIDSAYVIKILFSNIEKQIKILSNYNIVASKEFGKYVFHTYSDFFKKQWLEKRINTVKFYHNRDHFFNEQLARKFDDFNVTIANKFQMKPLNLRYFLFRNTEDRYRYKGYDFDVGMFETIQKSAEVDLYNNIIYASNGTEYYPHEVIHFYTYNKFGNTLCRFFDEGLATLLAGNINATFKEDAIVLKKFIQKHPNFDFSNLTGIKEHVANTNFEYTISAILCDAVLQRGGWSGLNNVLKCGNKIEDVYRTLESELGLEKQDINSFIVKQLNAF
ncbi:MAG: hypothetical protein ACK55U_05205 [Bacteroidota bacterium]